jgi:hypothetical protein
MQVNIATPKSMHYGIAFISNSAFMNSLAGMLNTWSMRRESFPAIL